MSSRTSRLSAAGGSILLVAALAVGSSSPAGAVPDSEWDDDRSNGSYSHSGVRNDLPGYTGVADPGSSRDPERDDQEKQEDFGPVGHQSASATDVPGQEVDSPNLGEEANAIPAAEAV